MSIPDHLIRHLPDHDSVSQFVSRFEENNASHFKKLLRNEALLSDVLTLVAYSPLLAATLLQNPDYAWWLNRRRKDKGIRGKEELLESLARFALTNSQLEDQVLLARFRRRELLRIYLADIRRLLTIAEITEELSNLADAILEFALRIARQELDNRFGGPFEIDEKARERPSKFCIVSLGKLGSRELNYSSDIDLLFLYSAEGETSGIGSRGKLTNREYFVKLAELIAKLIGQQTGEGATYRVDLRLRPHGRVGPLAMSVSDTVRYYKTEAADWERQVLIRSRGGAGDAELFSQFFGAVEPSVFSESQSVSSALRSVKLSKQKIDFEHGTDKGFDAKLGRGGIREIEFIAQALQLAYGGRDKWLRAGHTLISLSRLADRGLIQDSELSELFEAYSFLRRLEHVLQMEHGLQTHLVPADPDRRALVARRMRFDDTGQFDESVAVHSSNVHRVFRRIFSDENIGSAEFVEGYVKGDAIDKTAEFEPSAEVVAAERKTPDTLLENLRSVSPKFAEMIKAHPDMIRIDPDDAKNYDAILLETVRNSTDLRSSLASLRQVWHELIIEIAALDAARKIDFRESKRRQTQLAEACIKVALENARSEMEHRLSVEIPPLRLAVIGLGKLGGAGIDHESDLDLVLVFDDSEPVETGGLTPIEFYSRAAEIFVNVLSGYTREGNLYRVDLRLRPHGKNGPNVISRSSFAAYIHESAAIWELLAFVKARGAGGENAREVESEIVDVVFARSASMPHADLASETRRIRLLLEKDRGTLRRGEVNLKYGPGGMLDTYFAIRFLQLRDGVRDNKDDRSTDFMLDRLVENGSLSRTEFESLSPGYRFLSKLDHAMRLTIGRSHVIPKSESAAFKAILARMEIHTEAEFHEQLALHRLNIREAFDSVTL